MCKYTFPPVNILHQVLCRTRQEKESILLVAPKWPTQPWFPDLLEMLSDPQGPFLWGRTSYLKRTVRSGTPTWGFWDLHIWPLNGVPQLQSHCPSRWLKWFMRPKPHPPDASMHINGRFSLTGATQRVLISFVLSFLRTLRWWPHALYTQSICGCYISFP